MSDLNTHTKDENSIVTSYGKHQRVVAFLPYVSESYKNRSELYCRVDCVNDLPEPTHEQILKVARKDQGVKGKYRFHNSVSYLNNGHKVIDYFFIS